MGEWREWADGRKAESKPNCFHFTISHPAMAANDESPSRMEGDCNVQRTIPAELHTHDTPTCATQPPTRGCATTNIELSLGTPLPSLPLKWKMEAKKIQGQTPILASQQPLALLEWGLHSGLPIYRPNWHIAFGSIVAEQIAAPNQPGLSIGLHVRHML